MAKCVVTGGLGFIGSNLVDLLIQEGHEVLIIDNLSTGTLDNLNPKAGFLEEDIRTADIPKGTDYLFHFASLARIQPSIKEPYPHHDVNVNGTLKLLDQCREKRIKIIFSSSSSIYSQERIPTPESSKKAPASPYALQKYVCEQYIKLYHHLYELDYCILRYFNVFGERQILEGSYAAVVGIFQDQKAKGQTLTVVGDGSQKRDFTYVKDVARANLMAINWEGIFNIGTGTNYSILELAQKISDDITFIPERLGEYQETKADNRKAKAEGWRPTKDIMDWVEEQNA